MNRSGYEDRRAIWLGALAYAAFAIVVAVPTQVAAQLSRNGELSVRVNLTFPPTQADLDQLVEQMGRAQRILCDATDRNVKLTNVIVQRGFGHSVQDPTNGNEEGSDIIWVPQRGRSYASGQIVVFGTSESSSMVGHLIAHELSHRVLGVGDSYDEQRRNGTSCGIGPSFDADVRSDETWNSLMQGPGQTCRNSAGLNHAEINPLEWWATGCRNDADCLQFGTSGGVQLFTCPVAPPLSTELSVATNHDLRMGDWANGFAPAACPAPRAAGLLQLNAKLNPADSFPTNCGNGMLEPSLGEECETTDPIVACSTLGRDFTGGTASCVACRRNVMSCSRGTCGDGADDLNEPCDPNSSAALPTCASASGNVFDFGEMSCRNNCSLNPQACAPRGVFSCGNGVVNFGEACDGAAVGGQTCAGLGFVGGSLECGANCWFNTANCMRTPCGNGVIDADEECEPTVALGTTCQDKGFASGTLQCDANCSFDNAACVTQASDDFDPTSFATAAVRSVVAEFEVFDALGRVDAYWEGASNHHIYVYLRKFDAHHWMVILAGDFAEYDDGVDASDLKEIARYDLAFSPSSGSLIEINGVAVDAEGRAIGGEFPSVVLGGAAGSEQPFGEPTNGAEGQVVETGAFNTTVDGLVAPPLTLELRFGAIAEATWTTPKLVPGWSAFFFGTDAGSRAMHGVGVNQLGSCRILPVNPTDDQDLLDSVRCAASWNSDTERFEATHHSLLQLRGANLSSNPRPLSDWEVATNLLRSTMDTVTPPVLEPSPAMPSAAQCGGLVDVDIGDFTVPDQVVMVLDRSGSMSAPANVPANPAQSRLEYVQAAARAFVELQTGKAAQVGLVSFARVPNLEVGLAQVGNGAGLTPKGTFITAINALTPHGATGIGIAMLEARAQLNAASMGVKAILLLTDGENNRPLDGTSQPLDVAKELEDQGIQVYTVPVGAATDLRGLSEIAGMTGAAMFEAPEGNEVPPAFLEAYARTRGEVPVLPRETFVLQEAQPDQPPEVIQSKSFTIHVEADARRLDLMLSSAGTANWQPLFELRNPSGTLVANQSSSIVITHSLYRMLLINNPAPGDWIFRVTQGGAYERSHVIGHVEHAGPDCFARATPTIANGTGDVLITVEAKTGALSIDRGVSYNGILQRPDRSTIPLTFQVNPAAERYEAHVAPSDLVGRGQYEARVRCEVSASARLREGEPLIPDQPFMPKDPIDPFVRNAQTSFFLNVTTLPPLPPGTDADHDGIPNTVEIPLGDTDGDGLPDVLDDDSDNDDTPDATDPAPRDPSIPVELPSGCHADGNAPIITAPNATISRCTSAPTDVAVSASATDDSCADPALVQLAGRVLTVNGKNVPGTPAVTGSTIRLPVGVSAIEWTASDVNGNTSTVIQQITVTVSDSTAACCVSGMQVITGNAWPNVYILPLPFNYCVFGKGGIDTIVTGLGVDLLSGGDGNDVLTTGSTNDVCVGGAGSDLITLPIGSGKAFGGTGNDFIKMTGTGVLYGNAGDDEIIGILGTHEIFPGPGRDVVAAGPGNDVVHVYDACELQALEVLDGGLGIDILYTPIPVASLVAMGVVVLGFEQIVVTTADRHLSECF